MWPKPWSVQTTYKHKSYMNSTDKRGSADSPRICVLCYEAEETNNVNLKALLYTWLKTSLCATLPLDKHSENTMIKPYVQVHTTFSLITLNDFVLAWIFIKNVVGRFSFHLLGFKFTITAP